MVTMQGAETNGLAATLGTVSTVDAFAAMLEERVLAGELKPGDRIREASLAATYQVARHTARAALTRLTSMGLLKFQANRGWSVSEMTAEEFADLAFLRVGLEVQAMRELAVRGEKVSPQARALLAELLNAGPEVSWIEKLRIDMRLHRALVDQAGSRRVSEVYLGVQSSLQMYLVARVEWFERTPDEAEFHALHHKLCDVIDSGDPAEVERHLRMQLNYQVPS